MRNLKVKSAAVNCSLALLSLIVGLILLEVIVRPISGMVRPYGVEPDDPTEDIRAGVHDVRGFWTWKPNFRGRFDNGIDFSGKLITTNGDGSRTVPCLSERRKRPFRVFLIGDSQTFGWGLSDSETWANRFQCGLEKTLPGKVEVINLGFPGTQVDQYYARALGQLEDVLGKGDTVVVSLTWNDLVTFYAKDLFVQKALREAGLREVQVPPDNFAHVVLLDNSAVSRSAEDGRRAVTLQLSEPVIHLGKPSWRYPFYRRYGIFVPSFDSALSFLNSLQYVSATFRVAWTNARYFFYMLRSKGALEKKIPERTFHRNFLVLKALDARLRRTGAKVVIQLLPSRLFFDDYYYQFYSKRGTAFPRQDYLGYIAESFCNSLELRCLNRFDAVKTSQRDRHTFPVDGHYNATGAAKVADALRLDLFD